MMDYCCFGRRHCHHHLIKKPRRPVDKQKQTTIKQLEVKGCTALDLPGNETDAHNDRATDWKEAKPIDRKEAKPMTVPRN